MKFGVQFSNLLQIKRMKFYLNSFRFDISMVQCLAVYLLTGHNVIIITTGTGACQGDYKKVTVSK